MIYRIYDCDQEKVEDFFDRHRIEFVSINEKKLDVMTKKAKQLSVKYADTILKQLIDRL